MAMTKKGEDRWSLIMARAWAEPAFMQRLVADPAGVLKEYNVRVPTDSDVKIVLRMKDKAGKIDSMPFMTKDQASELSDELLETVAGGAGQPRFQTPKNLATVDGSHDMC